MDLKIIQYKIFNNEAFKKTLNGENNIFSLCNFKFGLHKDIE